jgi:glycosyltransferase involved in cell wall biosynthesis
MNDIKIRILFEGWRLVQHSYGQVLAFTLTHMYKMYGPEGTLGHKIDFYVKEAKYYNSKWNDTKKLVYNEEYNSILSRFKNHNGEEVDLIYRQTYPYNISVSLENRSVPKCIFYTSEYSHLDSSYFEFAKPTDDVPIDDYIAYHLSKMNNIFFTSPSAWSSNGMKRYLSMDDFAQRNRTIAHGVDTTVFFKHDTPSVRDKIRFDFNVKKDEILLINVGGAMTSNKGIPQIIHALHIMINLMNLTHYKLLLKGSGDLYFPDHVLNYYFQSFKNDNIMTQKDIDVIQSHILITNDTLSYSQINDLYNAADLYISPYIAEGFGLTMLEALASGLQILVPKTGSTKEYIEDIFNNGGGDEFITYVDSQVIAGPDGNCRNDIKLHDLINSITINETKFKPGLQSHNYLKMKNYIETEYSWYKVSRLLYEYFLDIIRSQQM